MSFGDVGLVYVKTTFVSNCHSSHNGEGRARCLMNRIITLGRAYGFSCLLHLDILYNATFVAIMVHVKSDSL